MNFTKLVIIISFFLFSHNFVKKYLLYLDVKKHVANLNNSIESFPLSKTLHKNNFSIGYSANKESDKNNIPVIINSINLFMLIMLNNPKHCITTATWESTSNQNYYSGFIIDCRPDHIKNTDLFIENIINKSIF